jgi:hypothetical protein
MEELVSSVRFAEIAIGAGFENEFDVNTQVSFAMAGILVLPFKKMPGNAPAGNTPTKVMNDPPEKDSREGATEPTTGAKSSTVTLPSSGSWTLVKGTIAFFVARSSRIQEYFLPGLCR